MSELCACGQPAPFWVREYGRSMCQACLYGAECRRLIEARRATLHTRAEVDTRLAVTKWRTFESPDGEPHAWRRGSTRHLELRLWHIDNPPWDEPESPDRPSRYACLVIDYDASREDAEREIQAFLSSPVSAGGES